MFFRGGRNGMGCFVRGGKSGMGCFVWGDKNCMGCFVRGSKLMRDVLSGVLKKWYGIFCPGMFCPTRKTPAVTIFYSVLILSLIT